MRSNVQVEINEARGRIADQHLRAVKRIHAGAVKLSAGRLGTVKLVDRHIITVNPGAEVRVVGEVLAYARWRLGWRLERIHIVGAGRVAGLRYCDTFEKRRGIAVGKIEL